MEKRETRNALSGEILDEEAEVTLIQMCELCALHAEAVQAMVDEGILEPSSGASGHGRFPHRSMKRVRVTVRLQQDLGVNLAGAALALDLLDEIEDLRARLRLFEEL
jgi:chaperone modulatory protein CbpM